MAISLVKEFKLKQKLSLTPQLKKSIDLLQLSRFELINKIEKEIVENPFIEKDESSFNDRSIADFNEFDFNVAATESLRDSLINQINEININKDEQEIALTIIDSLDETGCLTDGIDIVDEMLGYKYAENHIEGVLVNIIQQLDPAGVGFRDFKECIFLQIKRNPASEEELVITEKLLYELNVDDFDIALKKLSDQGYSAEQVSSVIEKIKNSNLSPGLEFKKSDYVYPDLKIKMLNDNFPKITIDESLVEATKKELKSKKNDAINEKIKEARWLMSSITKRNDTVYKVGEIILNKQISYLMDNPLNINPLSNKEIAEELKLHPSTISRILRSKYIDTPKGIIPLKSFLFNSVSKTRKVTSIQLMDTIKNIIKEEKKPKSDNQISKELNKMGYGLSRRTIAKYRKKLNIPSSRNR
jgi:RNA polymerase sigma-54 factor